MTEKQLEQKLKKEVEKLGGLCLKLTTPGFTGIPDRLILLPGGVVGIVELKRPKKSKKSERQIFVMRQLMNLGMTSCFIYDDSSLWDFIELIERRMRRR